jgi:hypothetical protein
MNVSEPAVPEHSVRDYEREGAVSCAADDRDTKHPNCRHAWNAAHPDDPITEAEQAAYQAAIK